MTDTKDDYAEDRTLLAVERTFASWMRLGASCIGIALGLSVVLDNAPNPAIPRSVAGFFLVIALFTFLISARRGRHSLKGISDRPRTRAARTKMTLTAGVLSTVALLVGGFLWIR
ncbi:MULTISPECIES: DUF202 domain-containing protein [unclassified Roseovarius]|uniref:DUF202 domain-containing protein n=1 Tax=unclassified Roseovarius TaxID=2614913 RepID=UPI00273EB893|nr:MULTISPECIES: DUF202 domain-containing protein [unclassified Roseovarius]